MVWPCSKNGRGKTAKIIMKWRPPGRRKRGRPKLTWAEGIRGMMGEKGLIEQEWNDRSNWRKNVI
jgi:hypothetical protein